VLYPVPPLPLTTRHNLHTHHYHHRSLLTMSATMMANLRPLQELEKIPLFMTKQPTAEQIAASPDLQAMQALIEAESTPKCTWCRPLAFQSARFSSAVIQRSASAQMSRTLCVQKRLAKRAHASVHSNTTPQSHHHTQQTAHLSRTTLANSQRRSCTRCYHSSRRDSQGVWQHAFRSCKEVKGAQQSEEGRVSQGDCCVHRGDR
jgi:hypothetical protein